MHENLIPSEPLSSFERFEAIGQAGVQKAIEESRRLGVPNVYSIDGVLHWELPNGELTTEDPYLKQQTSDQGKGTAEGAKDAEKQ